MKTKIVFAFFSALLIFLASCTNNIDVEIVNCSPLQYHSDYWAETSKRVLKDARIPETNEKKIYHRYLALVRVDDIIDYKKYLQDRPSDAVIISCLIKDDNRYMTSIFTDDPNGVKLWLDDN